MSITPDKAPETLLASDPNALFLKRTDEINELLDSGASLSGHERNCFFLNTGGGKFATASATRGFDFYDDARVVARSDWDHDGDIDLWFANRTAPRLSKHEMHKFYGLVRAQLYSELNLSTVQRGSQLVELDALGGWARA